MAIKGRSRRRARGRAAALPPRPHVPQRAIPLYRRRAVRAGAAIALGVAALLGGLRMWQNLSRSHSLRTYSEALLRAQEPLLRHLSPGSPTSFADLPAQFERGEIASRQFRDAAERWEMDFATARDRVVALRPPGPLVEAQKALVRGIDLYVGIARLYVPAAIQADLARREKDPRLRRDLQSQVTVLLAHAQEWRGRADEVYDLGQEQIEALRQAWLGETPIPRSDLPSVPGRPAGEGPP